jgi:cellulose synthase/poly-beta-1,6-N-acetylglucosamine synthase-like glycosyltransferase
MLNIRAFFSFHLFSPVGIVALLTLFLLFDTKPVFYGLEIFLLLNYAYRYVPVVIYMFRSRDIKKKLLPLPVKEVSFKHFIILVPAKNEAATLPGLLKSIAAQDYPRAHYRAVVVADNCTDNTCEVALAHGAECIDKRLMDAHPCKGACMAYAAKLFMPQELPKDTYFVIIDADCELATGYLAEVNKQLNGPLAASVLQSYRSVKNMNASVVASFDAASEEVRQLVVLGYRDMLGLNAFLHGSGTVYEKSVFFRMAARKGETAAEDKEWNAWLLEERIAIKWCPSARLEYNVYEKNAEFQKQRVRWVRGQFDTAKKFAGRALVQGIRKKNLSQVDYSFSLYQLPRSVMIFFAMLFSMVNLFYFNSPAWAYTWLLLCVATVPCEMLGMDMGKVSYKTLLATGFKMVWGVARSSMLGSVSFKAAKWWPDRSEIYKESAK